MKKILITTSSFDLNNLTDRTLLENAGYEIVLNPYGMRLTENQIVEMLDENVIAIIAGLEPLNETVLKKAPNLKVVSRCGIGVDNVDLDYAKLQDISVFNTPDAPSKAVAELTIAHIFSLSRRISEADRNIKNGNWKPLMGRLISQQTIGVIGYGRIGQLVVESLSMIGAKILVYDKEKVISTNKLEIVDLGYLLKNSNIVSLHIPYTPQTKNIIDSDALALFKKNALLINVARGGLVDEEALYEAIKSNNLGGAAIDCFSVEPYAGKLLELNNIQVTSHMGSYAIESRSMMEAEACSALTKGMREHGLL
jgi:D-3-phosphoglycerate dehydrogenase